MHAFLGGKPNIQPVATLSNGAGVKLRDEKDSKPAEKLSPRERRAAEKQALYDAREENIERRHREKLECVGSAKASIDEIGQTHKEMRDMLREFLNRQ